MQIDFHRRITRLLMVLAVAVIAATFLFLAPYSRGVQYYPVVAASCGVFLLELGNLYIQKLALDGFPTQATQRLIWLYVLYLVPITAGLVLLWLNSRLKKVRSLS